MTDDLRSFLEKREIELLDSMQRIRGEITRQQMLLVPLEAELSEIRRCKASIGIAAQPAGGIGAVRFAYVGTGGIGGHILNVDTLPRFETTATVPASGVVAYDDLTLKQLILKALIQHFPQNGATRSDLVAFFRAAWGREVQPNSLSPQLSRLASEGMIMYRDEDHRWELTSDGAALAMPIGILEAHRTPATVDVEVGPAVTFRGKGKARF